MIIHERYNASDYDVRFDIALMMTEDKIDFSNYTRPICLPDNSYDEPRSYTVIAAGWGCLRNGDSYRPHILKEVVLNLIDDKECHQKWNKLDGGTVYPAHICTLTQGKETCKGDSGGSLFEKGKILISPEQIIFIDVSVNHKATLVGIVSYTLNKSNEGMALIYEILTHFL